MKEPLQPTPSSGFRVFNASLLSFLLIMMPFVQVAAATRQRSAVRDQRSETGRKATEGANTSAADLFVNPPAMPLVGLTATKTDSYTAHPGPAAPGDEITYTVDINNPTGTEATGVTLTDIIDANTTRFGGDFALKVSPLAINDTYSATKNTPLVVSDTLGVLANDTGVPAPTANVIAAGPTTAGGTITLNADGSFTYTPPNATFTGADTFTYTNTNGNAPPNPGVDNQATVTINVDAAPEVSSTTPADNAIDQAGNTDISITFSEAVNVTGSWFTISCTSSGLRNVSDTVVTPNGSNTVFTINPNTDFTESEICTVTVFAAQVTDQDSNDPPDNMAADHVFDFTMDAAPTFISSNPVNGLTGVATSTNIAITFSEPVTASTSSFTISCPAPGNLQTYTVSGSGTATITLDPSSNLPAGTLCSVQIIGTQVFDTDTNDPPNTMTSSPVFAFTTDAAPTVSSSTPAQGATIVATSADITLNFSESVDIAAGGITLNCGAGNLAFTPALPQNGVSSIVIDPAANLPPNTLCTVTGVSTLITDADTGDPPNDLDGDNNGSEGPNFVLTFTTDAAPRVTSTTPLQGATQVGASTNITLNFSESVDIAAGGITVNCGAGNLSFTPALPQNGVSSIVINPDADLPFGTLCTVTGVAANISDVDSGDPPNQLDGNGDGTEGDNFTLTFTIDAPPTVTTTAPTDGSVDNAKGTDITINFSEAVNVSGSSFTIECPTPGNLQAFVVSGSGTSTIVLNPNSNLPAGVVCTVTVVANQVSDTDAGDPPDQLDGNNDGTPGDNYVFTFGVKPEAVNDIYAPSIVGNVGVNTDTSTDFSILTNDTPSSGVTINTTGTSLQGGTVVVALDGKFSYTPPVGYEGADSFTYTITNAAGTSNSATVSLTVAGMIWFIDGSAGAGNGRLATPFSSVASFQAINNGTGNNPAAGDNIFIYENASSYTGPITLLSNQKLIGQDATATLAAISGVVVPADSFPLPGMNSGNGTFTTLNVASAGVNVVNLNGVGTSNTVRGLSITTSSTTTRGISGSSFGTLTALDLSITGSGPVVDLSTGTVTVTLNTGSSNGSGAEGIRLDNLAGTFTISAGSLQSATNEDVDISGNNLSDTLAFTFAGTITDDAGTLISVANQNGGTKLFSGAITDGDDGDGGGISLTNNTGSTINFTGGVTLSTGANAAFTATGGGTVSATQDNSSIINKITTTTGTALNVTSTTIGASDLTFRSISSNGGTASGIILNNTGSSGGLHVTGTGTAGSGGTIQNKTGANITSGSPPAYNSGTLGTGIILVSTSDVQLDRMQLNNFSNFGIRGFSVNGFTFSNSTVNTTAGLNGDDAGQDEGSISFDNLTGTVSFTNVSIEDALEANARIVNTSGTLNLTVSGSTFKDNSPNVTGLQGLLIQSGLNAGDVANITANITNSTFTNNFARGIMAVHNQGGTMEVNIGTSTAGSGGTFDNNFAGVDIAHNGSGTTHFNVKNATFSDDPANVGPHINLFMGSASTAGSTFMGRVHGNVITGSNNQCCAGISSVASGAGTMTIAITNNNVSNIAQRGISVAAGQGSNTVNATITGNTVSLTDINSAEAIFATASVNAADTSTMNATIGGAGALQNNVSSVGGAEIRVEARFGRTFVLPGYNNAVHGSQNTAQVNAFTASNNNINGGTTSSTVGLAPMGNFVGSPATPTPTNSNPLLAGEGGVESALNSYSLLAGVAFPGLAASTARCGADDAKRSLLPESAGATVSLTQQQLDSIVSAATQRWIATGLTPQQVAAMRELRFDLGDLAGAYLGEAVGNRIVVDRNAQGKGWFVDATPADDLEFRDRTSATRSYTNPFTSAAGRMDLLTAIEHEIGHKLGLVDSYADADRDSIMYGYLTVGERRVPAKGQAANAQAGSLTGTHYLKKAEGRKQKADGRKQTAVSRKNHAATTRALAPVSGETLTHSIGELPAGKSVRITFKVTINAGFSGPTVSNQGTVTGTLGGGFSISTDDPDVPPNAGETDPTVTQIVGPTTANDDAYNTFKNTPLNIAAPGVLGNDANVTSVTGVGGCADVTDPFSACPTTGGGTVTMNGNGSFSYTPLIGFTGPDTFTYSVTGGTGTDTATVTITVADTSAIYLNEVLFHPDATGTNEYIELRGPANATIPAGTYLVVVDGDAGTTAGDVTTIIDLSGLSFGTNGFLVLLQNGNTYTTAAGATVITSTTTGFGSLAGAPWQADGGATSLENSGATFMLIQTGTAPTLTDDVDANDDGTPDGTVYAGWSVRDSVGHLTGANANDRAYGAINYITGGSGTGSGTVVTPSFISVYVGRICDSTGSTATDWVASDGLGGSAPNWTLGSNTSPATFAFNPLDHIGTTNFINNAPVNTVPGAQNVAEEGVLTFNAGNANLISIADSDAGGNDVQVTLTATNGVVSLSGTAGLSFSFTDGNGTGAGDGIADATMTFRGTVSAINTALDGLTFTPTSNYDGPASVQIVTNDLGSTGGAACSTTQSDSDTVNITVNGVNDAPQGDDNTLALNEDATRILSQGNFGFTDPSDGNGFAGVVITTLPTNGTLLLNGTPITIAGTFVTVVEINSNQLVFQPDADENGTPYASFTFQVRDNGGTTGGGQDTDQSANTLTFNVTAVNDAPTFQIASNPPAVNEDAGAQTVNSFATNFQPGPVTATDEGTQTLAGYTVTQTGGTLAFSSAPAIDTAGTLTYTTAANSNGTATFDVVATDSGSSTAPNVNVSAPISFTITVNSVNDEPSFTKGPDQAVPQNAGAQTVSGWATNISAGPPDEVQTVTFTVNVTGTTGTLAFDVAPAVSSTGTLTYHATNGTSGVATVDIFLTDNGSGIAPNDNTSPTQTFTITVAVDVSVHDASVAEPSSGTTNMVFTVSLNTPAPAGGAAVNYTTADEPAGPGKAVAGVCGSGGDYVLTSGTINFAAGEQVKSISVPVCSDGTAEPDETFLVNLSVPVNATIADPTATGTITAANTAGSILISEIRTSGPSGSQDEFVEIYNNSNSPHTVAASDASAGYGVFIMGADCNATPILVGIISNGIVLPARGHFLFVGSAYSLGPYATGNATLTADIPSDANVAIFSTTDVSKLSTLTRYDAVGFGTNVGGNCDLLREGSNLPAVAGSTTEHSFFRKLCDFSGSFCTTLGIPKDANNNATDFLFADTQATDIPGVPPRLGAPGPENLASPLKRDATIAVTLLDTTMPPPAVPNRKREVTDPVYNSPFGTLKVRRRIINNTGANVTRLRFRIVEMTTTPPPQSPGIAVLRARTSSGGPVSDVNDPATCFASTGLATTPCTVTVEATTLEQPPTQPLGGGLNATLAAGTVTLGTPLANGASVNVEFLLGIQQTGAFRFLIIVEALP